jgi:hypothetical protein
MARLSIFLLLILVACNPIRKAERLILNDKAASERVFRALEPSHPCANDTTFITDLDTLVTYEHFIAKVKPLEFKGFAITPAPDTIIKTIKVNKIHTAYIVDTRTLGIALDSVRYYKTLAQVHKDTSNAWSRRFWVLLGSLIIIGFLKYKL